MHCARVHDPISLRHFSAKLSKRPVLVKLPLWTSPNNRQQLNSISAYLTAPNHEHPLCILTLVLIGLPSHEFITELVKNSQGEFQSSYGHATPPPRGRWDKRRNRTGACGQWQYQPGSANVRNDEPIPRSAGAELPWPVAVPPAPARPGTPHAAPWLHTDLSNENKVMKARSC